MANIPTQIDQQLEGELSKGLDIPTGGAEAFGIAGRHVAQQIRVATEGVAGVADRIQQHNDIKESTDWTNAAVGVEKDALGDGPNSWKVFHANGGTAQDYYDQKYAPAWDKTLDTISSPRVREAATRGIGEKKITGLQHFLSDQVSSDQESAVSSADNHINTNANLIQDDPTRLAVMGGNHDAEHVILKAAGYTPGQLDKYDRATDNHYAKAAAEGYAGKAELVGATPAQLDLADKQINDQTGFIWGHLTPEEREGFNARIAKAKATQTDIQSYALSAHGEDALRSIAQNDQAAPQSRQVVQYLIEHPTGASATERAKSSEEWSVKLAHADATAKATQSTAGMNRDQLVQIERTKPVNPSEEQSALVETATTQRKAMDGDPANTLIDRSPTVRNAAVAFTSNPTPQTWAAYRTASAALQRQYNPARPPRLVPQGMHDQIAQDMQGITQDANGATQAGGTLSKWAGITGSDWPNVAEELRATHVINNDQYAASELYGKAGQGGLTNALLQSSTMTNDQRHMLHGIEIGPAKTAAAQAFDGFNKTFANIPNSQGFIEAQTDALAHLIQTKGLNPKDLDVNDPQDPIMQMAHDMVLDEFNIVGDTLRVPSKQNADAIEAGTVRAQGNIDHPGKDPHWYTTPDGNGATLYPEPGASAPIAVNGKPLTLTWKQLATLGQQ